MEMNNLNATPGLAEALAGATTLEAMKEVVLQLSAQHEADMAQQRAMTDIASRSSSEPRVDSYRERVPKLNKPDEFHGVRKELSSFLFQIDLRFKGDPMLFRTEASRVVYAISFLKGAAYRWVVPAQRAGLDTMYPTYALFEKAIRVAFGDPDEKGSALRAVAQLRQRGPCYEYSSEFQRLTAVLDWNVDALRDMYRNGLSNDVKDQLIHVEDTGTTLEDLIEKAQVIDRRIFERRVDRGKERTTSYAPRAFNERPWQKRYVEKEVRWKSPSSGVSTAEPMDIDNINSISTTMSPQKKVLFKDGKCFACEKTGHLARDCPLRGAKN